MKKALIIMNPFAGTKRANKYLTDIIHTFTVEGYFTSVLTTTKRGDGAIYAMEQAGDFDLIVAIGGDGTFNEVVSGVIKSGNKVPIGYIPAGSTNDFASSLELSKNVVEAAKDIVQGEPVPLDIGEFNGRTFSYVASFGAFTKTSYDTPQNIKNALGHLAYILQGISSITSIRAEHMKIEADGVIYEGDYLFGAISNSTSMGGVLRISSELVDMSDGSFEMLLIKMPRDLLDLTEIIQMLMRQEFDLTDKIIFVNSKRFQIEASSDTAWSLDGEYQEGTEKIEIVNRQHAINLMVR